MDAFSRSLRAIHRDKSRGFHVALACTAVLLTGWTAWFFLAPLRIYEVSQAARLEMDRAAYPIESQVGGRIVATHLPLGEEVRSGDVLVELDATSARTELAEARSRLDTVIPKIARIQSELSSRLHAKAELTQASQAALDEAREEQHGAESSERYTTGQLDRSTRLRDRGLISDVEMLHAKTDAESARAAVSARVLEVRRLELQALSEGHDRDAKIEELRRDALDLDQERARSGATIERLEHEIELYRLRAPVDGKVAEAADLRPGSVLSANQRVAFIVRKAPFRVVALFRPETAAGRIRMGQPAQLRLSAFPWIQYGSVPLRVENVSSEARDNLLRVELSIRNDEANRIPLQHGLPGSVEVEVERLTPVDLGLRAAGKVLAFPEEHPAGRADVR